MCKRDISPVRQILLVFVLGFGWISCAQATPAYNCDPNNNDFTLPQGYTAIDPIRRVPPVYPMAALENRQAGYVLVEFDVTTEGEPDNIEIVEAEPYWGFRDASRDALRQWRYEPHTIDGIPVVCEGVRFQFDYQIDPNSQ